MKNSGAGINTKHKTVFALVVLLCLLSSVFIWFKSSLWADISAKIKEITRSEVDSMKISISPGLLIANKDGTASSIQGFDDCGDGKAFNCIVLKNNTHQVSFNVHKYSSEISQKLTGRDFVGASSYDLVPNENLTVRYSNGVYALFRSDGSPLIPWNGATVYRDTSF